MIACVVPAEYSWYELADIWLPQLGFSRELQCFNAYLEDDAFWDHSRKAPRPHTQAVLEAVKQDHRDLRMLGSTMFIVAHKSQRPTMRLPPSLYAYAKNVKFKGYPACKQLPNLCRPAEVQLGAQLKKQHRRGRSSTKENEQSPQALLSNLLDSMTSYA